MYDIRWRQAIFFLHDYMLFVSLVLIINLKILDEKTLIIHKTFQ